MWLATRDAAYTRVTQAVADRQMDTQMGRWMDRHCATIRASLAPASRANKLVKSNLHRTLTLNNRERDRCNRTRSIGLEMFEADLVSKSRKV